MWFNTPKEELDRDFTLLEPGTYRFKIIDASYGPLKSGNGSAFTVAADVTEGPSKGSRIFAHYNTDHTSEKARQIGRGQFKRLLAALGISKPFAKPQDACDTLPGKTFVGEVEHELGTDGKTRAKLKRPIVETTNSMPQPTDDVDSIPF